MWYYEPSYSNPETKRLTKNFFIGSNNYNNYIETYSTKKAVNEVRICASQSTYYNIQQNLQYATYREKRLKLTASGVALGYIDRHYSILWSNLKENCLNLLSAIQLKLAKKLAKGG